MKVLTKELTAIRLACEEMEQLYPAYVKGFGGKKYEPPVTFIVVQKRHHTRLFCANRAVIFLDLKEVFNAFIFCTYIVFLGRDGKRR